MPHTTQQLRADFDRIAIATAAAGAAPKQDYHAFLLRHVPAPCRDALEVGCGTGEFTRRLAERCGHVLALDLSPEMIRVARERAAAPNVEFRIADVLDTALPEAGFDCIASIATLHHLPAADTLRRLKAALRPGGVLLLQDVLSWSGPLGWPVSALAMLTRLAGLRPKDAQFLAGSFMPPAGRAGRELRDAWRAHGGRERYLRPAEVRALCRAELPGARMRFHLLWRWSAVWTRPGATPAAGNP